MKKYSIHCRDFITHEVDIIPDLEFDEREWTEQIWSDPWREANAYNSKVVIKAIEDKFPDVYCTEVNRGLWDFNKRSDYKLKKTAYIMRDK